MPQTKEMLRANLCAEEITVTALCLQHCCGPFAAPRGSLGVLFTVVLLRNIT